MKISQLGLSTPLRRGRAIRVAARRVVITAGFVGLFALTGLSAIALKEASRSAPALADVRAVPTVLPAAMPVAVTDAIGPAVITPASAGSLSAFLHPRTEPARAAAIVPTRVADRPAASVRPAAPSLNERLASDPNVRWFNGRPVKPAKTMWMVVTGYSPDARSCGEFADGKTATLHSVTTNDHSLVAADPRVLPYGSMVTVPGYDSDLIVPVLDCGGAIKGNRLDLLFPTHEQARKWGKKRVKVTIWQYADGKPMDNPRKLRG